MGSGGGVMTISKLTGNDEDKADEKDNVPDTEGTQDFFLRPLSFGRLHLDDVITHDAGCG